jgi:hypothetical protein
LESWETELCNKLYKTEEEQQIFLGFRILQQERKEKANKAKYFWIFSNTKLKLENKANQSLESYRGK